MTAGQVIVLNGAPRSGKTSIASAIQAGPGEWMAFGVDLLRAATPPALQPGIGLRPGGERPDLEDFVVASYLSLYDSVAAHAVRGLSVVVDVGHHDDYSRPLRILETVAPTLARLGALFVSISCPLEALMHRRHATGWSEQPFTEGSEIPTNVERWSTAVHDPGIYDLEIDTSGTTPENAAATIRARLDGNPPTAFAILARADPRPER
ncbi:MAG: phosphotransferase-like protein [Acidimicrobiales bacterium]